MVSHCLPSYRWSVVRLESSAHWQMYSMDLENFMGGCTEAMHASCRITEKNELNWLDFHRTDSFDAWSEVGSFGIPDGILIVGCPLAHLLRLEKVISTFGRCVVVDSGFL